MNFSERFMVKPDTKVKLDRHDPGETLDYDKKKAKAKLKKNVKRLKELQYLLYAENKRALLIVLQALDTGGKDGTIRHVLGPVNPQGCRVTAFNAPSEEELAHDFLWRIHKAVPRKGEIGVFNRSHYEDVLVVRVHDLVPKCVWSARYDQISAFEAMLAAGQIHILKFYLHISKGEQLERLKARLEEPDKHWKVDPKDFEERKYWDDYTAAYEEAISRCNAGHAPWFIIPADHKWFRNLAISEILIEQLESYGMEFPQPRYDIARIVAR